MDKSSIKILLVEDDQGDIMLAKKMLANNSESLNFVVESVKSMSEAAQYVSGEQKYDVILLDMGLPDSYGVETVQKISQINPHIPIVVFTGLDDEEVGRLTIQNGASDYLVKNRLSGEILVRTLIIYF
jgi:CheY-like chemotaxis protein